MWSPQTVVQMLGLPRVNGDIAKGVKPLSLSL